MNSKFRTSALAFLGPAREIVTASGVDCILFSFARWTESAPFVANRRKVVTGRAKHIRIRSMRQNHAHMSGSMSLQYTATDLLPVQDKRVDGLGLKNRLG
jgi:hypothetical protein